MNVAVRVVARPCHSCGVMVYDLRHIETKRIAPIEVAPSASGNIAIDLEAGTYLLTGRDFRYPEREHFINHFANCPAALKYRAGRPLRGR
jgi:hypothetical protein